jgi:predicted CXXCH cytochrome family protein
MAKHKDLNSIIREHQQKTGKSFMAALRDVLAGKLCPVCSSKLKTRVVLSMEGVELDGDETDGQIAEYYSALDSGESGEWGVEVEEPYCPKCDSPHPKKKSKDHQLIDRAARQANREGKLQCPYCGTAGAHYDQGNEYCPQCSFPRWSSKKERKEFYATQSEEKFFCRCCNKSYEEEQLEAPDDFECGTCHRSFTTTQAKTPRLEKGERICFECHETYTQTQTDQRTCSEDCEQALEAWEDL